MMYVTLANKKVGKCTYAFLIKDWQWIDIEAKKYASQALIWYIKSSVGNIASRFAKNHPRHVVMDVDLLIFFLDCPTRAVQIWLWRATSSIYISRKMGRCYINATWRKMGSTSPWKWSRELVIVLQMFMFMVGNEVWWRTSSSNLGYFVTSLYLDFNLSCDI